MEAVILIKYYSVIENTAKLKNSLLREARITQKYYAKYVTHSYKCNLYSETYLALFK
jgi:hypothetical protein